MKIKAGLPITIIASSLLLSVPLAGQQAATAYQIGRLLKIRP
jgi:hypothetical protein